MIKAFIFDMDGVIIDSEPLHFQSDKLVMKEFGIDIPDSELMKFVGVTNPKMWADLIKSYNLGASIEKLLEIQNKYKRELFGQGTLQAISGIPELISDLKERNILLGLASSSSREFIEMILKNLNIYDYFDIVISGEEVKNSKPAPDIFLKAAEGLGVKPSECIVLEDSGHGVNAAKAAGMKCIAFKNPSSGNQDLSLADCLVCTLEKLNYMEI
ncbi:MAG: HAD-superfamily hydrolase, subfamily variant 3 [Eubacterium sp.]|jgi:beta-phosphoglucomutase family hydrolase|nr:HAD-superfamily hydrolase, subfamily variant 3 [Eubacterium sp.]